VYIKAHKVVRVEKLCAWFLSPSTDVQWRGRGTVPPSHGHVYCKYTTVSIWHFSDTLSFTSVKYT